MNLIKWNLDGWEKKKETKHPSLYNLLITGHAWEQVPEKCIFSLSDTN